MERIISLDVLRGIALLGILLMNVVGFAYPFISYLNPSAYQATTLNNIIFSINYVLVDQKMMGLFSLLFGASITLLSEALTKKGKSTAGIYYSRTWWLFVFGLLHGVFIWEGDVLIVYAICGVFLYWCRNWYPSLLFALGIVTFLISSCFQYYAHLLIMALDPAALIDLWQPTLASINEEIQLRQSTYMEQFYADWANYESEPITAATDLFYASFYIDALGRASGMMLIGMALYRWGVLTNQRSRHFYRGMLRIGLFVGLVLASLGLWLNNQHDWHYSYSVFGGRIFNNVATLFLVAAYIGLIMLFIRSSKLSGLQLRLQAVGKMALTNYIMQSMLGLLVFTGAGLGLFSYLNRLEQLAFVLAVWVLQLFISLWWLRYFRYGPLEWCWRCLTYFKLQPLFKTNTY